MVKSTEYGERAMSKEIDDNIHSIILRPYITEKTFNLIEKENKLTFIVADKATKKDVSEAIETMYEGNVKEVNIFRSRRHSPGHRHVQGLIRARLAALYRELLAVGSARER